MPDLLTREERWWLDSMPAHSLASGKTIAAKFDALQASLVSAQEALRQGAFDGEPECPVCRGVQPTHYPTCALAAVLAGTAERQEPKPDDRCHCPHIGPHCHGDYGCCDACRAGSAEPPAKPEEETT